jgi:hypothetical protein
MRIFLLFFFLPFFTFAQFHPKKIGEVTGLVYFSVWEEDTLGNVLDGTKEVLFQHNYSVDLVAVKNPTQITVSEFKQKIFQFVSTPKTVVRVAKISWKDSVLSFKKKLIFKRKTEENNVQLSFVKRNGNWLVFKQIIPLKGDTLRPVPKRVLLFVNGYRGYEREENESDNLVTSKDRYHYWFKLDDRFIDTLKPSESYYLDGSLSVKTSNHRNTIRFVKSYYLSNHFVSKNDSLKKYNRLNVDPNPEGFNYRKDKGRIGGKALLIKLHQQQKDTVDIVCHSMGYAYALGMIEVLKDKVVFGSIYILSPENGCQDGVDWTQFKQVWQYGSNLDQPNPDPVWEQDGIAPQCQVKGLFFDATHGRAFIPKTWPKKNFVDSHMPINYDWIFDRIQKGEAGYIRR